MNADNLAMLALAPARPRSVAIVTARLSNDTDLKWDANEEPDLAGYEILWRDTRQRQPSHALNVLSLLVESPSLASFFNRPPSLRV